VNLFDIDEILNQGDSWVASVGSGSDAPWVNEANIAASSQENTLDDYRNFFRSDGIDSSDQSGNLAMYSEDQSSHQSSHQSVHQGNQTHQNTVRKSEVSGATVGAGTVSGETAAHATNSSSVEENNSVEPTAHTQETVERPTQPEIASSAEREAPKQEVRAEKAVAVEPAVPIAPKATIVADQAPPESFVQVSESIASRMGLDVNSEEFASFNQQRWDDFVARQNALAEEHNEMYRASGMYGYGEDEGNEMNTQDNHNLSGEEYDDYVPSAMPARHLAASVTNPSSREAAIGSPADQEARGGCADRFADAYLSRGAGAILKDGHLAVFDDFFRNTQTNKLKVAQVHKELVPALIKYIDQEDLAFLCGENDPLDLLKRSTSFLDLSEKQLRLKAQVDYLLMVSLERILEEEKKENACDERSKNALSNFWAQLSHSPRGGGDGSLLVSSAQAKAADLTVQYIETQQRFAERMSSDLYAWVAKNPATKYEDMRQSVYKPLSCLNNKTPEYLRSWCGGDHSVAIGEDPYSIQNTMQRQIAQQSSLRTSSILEGGLGQTSVAGLGDMQSGLMLFSPTGDAMGSYSFPEAPVFPSVNSGLDSSTFSTDDLIHDRLSFVDCSKISRAAEGIVGLSKRRYGFLSEGLSH
jgi:hypothetical protein